MLLFSLNYVWSFGVGRKLIWVLITDRSITLRLITLIFFQKLSETHLLFFWPYIHLYIHVDNLV